MGARCALQKQLTLIITPLIHTLTNWKWWGRGERGVRHDCGQKKEKEEEKDPNI